MKTDYTPKMLETVRNFFTDTEWLAIEEALGDYQDYGDNAAELASQIGDKMSLLYDTNTNKFSEVN